MKRLLTKMTMALALGGSLIAAVPAQARGHDGYGGGGHGWGDHGGRGGYGRGYGGYDRHDGGYRGGYYGGGYGYRGYYGPRYYGGYDDAGIAIGAGVLGLALGAAIADRPSYYDDGYYGY
jgi:hypothetical protein